ncbi:MAG TPA: DUF1634 domain-containing protein [Gammaproteobacteria bacterium]|jgi:uncharacterized membrane protein|nr:DUF1634 domain-containing protein [Gammaproteobacteria bacterium]
MSEKLEAQRRLITLAILRLSIGLAVFSILVGLTLFLARGAVYFPRAPSGRIDAILAYVWHEALAMRPSAFLEAGLLVILFTPLARLASGVVANARMRDWLYVGIGAVVIGLVLTGLFTGQSGG